MHSDQLAYVVQETGWILISWLLLCRKQCGSRSACFFKPADLDQLFLIKNISGFILFQKSSGL